MLNILKSVIPTQTSYALVRFLVFVIFLRQTYSTYFVVVAHGAAVAHDVAVARGAVAHDAEAVHDVDEQVAAAAAPVAGHVAAAQFAVAHVVAAPIAVVHVVAALFAVVHVAVARVIAENAAESAVHW